MIHSQFTTTKALKFCVAMVSLTAFGTGFAQNYNHRVCVQDEYSQQVVCGRMVSSHSQQFDPNPQAPLYPSDPTESVSNAALNNGGFGGLVWDTQRPRPFDDDRITQQNQERSLQVAMDRVNQLYRDVLGRDGDYGSLRNQANAVLRGKKLSEVRQDLAGSPEARQAIANLYRDVLRRQADTPGLNNHWDRLQRGATLGQIRADLANSQEGRNIR